MMTSSFQTRSLGSAGSRRIRVCLALFTLPLLVHAAVVSTMAWRHGWHELDGIDFGVLAASLALLLALAISVRDRRRWGRLLLCVYSLLLAVGVGDMLVRVVHPPPPPEVPWQPVKLRRVAADTMPGVSGTIEFTINSMGIRGPEVDLDEVDVSILCVGGSTTQCFYVTDEESWPWRTGELLSECLDRRVYVGNAGKSAHLLAQHDYLLRRYKRAREFDWVVVLAGFNDANRALTTSESRLHGDLSDTLTPVAEPFSASRYYRRLAIVRLSSSMRDGPVRGHYAMDLTGEWYRGIRRDRQEALAQRTIHEPPEELPRMLADYRGDIRKLIATSREYGQRIVFLTHTTAFAEEGGSPVLEKCFMTFHSPHAAYSSGAYARIINAYNATLRDVCREEDVVCIDLAAQLRKDETVFYDDCHFNTSGCARVADILSEFFCRTLSPDTP